MKQKDYLGLFVLRFLIGKKRYKFMSSNDNLRAMTIRLDQSKQDFFDIIKQKLGISSDNECFKSIITQYEKIVKATGLIIFDEEEINELQKNEIIILREEYKKLQKTLEEIKNTMNL